MPKSVQAKAKSDLQEIERAGSGDNADKAMDRFVAKYGLKYDRATACLTKDRIELLAFHDFPADHWKHLRSSNPIESTFANVRLRTDKTKGCLSLATALAMVFKLAKSAERTWRKRVGSEQLGKLIEGVTFRDAEPPHDTEAYAAA